MGVTTGMNRTGMDLSPIDSNDVLETSRATVPSSPGDERDAALVRSALANEAPPIGSVPPPATLKGMVESAAQMIQGKVPSALLDKLGERLAFERTSSRLYEGIIAKFDGKGSFPGGPAREDLVAIRDEEARHFEILRQAIVDLGGDPTAMTPGADVQGVASMGLLQVVADPRTTLAQALEAAHIAELSDNDAWFMLIDMVRAFGMDDLVDAFNLARAEEERHLELVRRWISDYSMLEIRGIVESPHKKAA